MQYSRYHLLLERVKALYGNKVDYSNRLYWIHCQKVQEICTIILTEHGYDLTNMFNSNEYDDLIITSLFHDALEHVLGREKIFYDILSIEEYKNMKRLRLLTKDENTSYDEYIDNILTSNDWITILVKFADVLDNVERLPFIEDEKIRENLTKQYLNPLKLLRNKVSTYINYLPSTFQYVLPREILRNEQIPSNQENRKLVIDSISRLNLQH